MATQLVLPRVHVMVMSDAITTSEGEENVFDLIGIRSELRAPVFPYLHPQMIVYLQVTGHQGRVLLQIRIEESATDNLVLATPLQECEFQDPLSFSQVAFSLDACVYPRPGLYYVQVYHEGKLIGERSFRLLDSTEFSDGQ
jgi:hypothetical protein